MDPHAVPVIPRSRPRRPHGAFIAAWLAVPVLLVLAWAAAGADPTVAFDGLCFAAVGLLLAIRRPREPIGWMLILIAASLIAVGTTLPGSANDVVNGRLAAGPTVLAWFNAWSSVVFFDTFAALAAVFPTGRFPAGRVGRVARVAVAIPVLFATGLAFAPTLNPQFADGTTAAVRNPIGLADGWGGWPVVQVGVYAAVLASLAVAIATFVVRQRRAAALERAQGKWLLAALGLVLGAVIFAFVAILLVDASGTWMWTPAAVAYALIPLAIGIAVSRYRLYEIDRIIGRTVGWAIVTILLVAVFSFALLGIQALLVDVTQGQTLAVAASTLAAFALFQPLRHRVQSAVDRRFDRARYDARRTVDAFSERLRGGADLAGIRDEIERTVDVTVRPGHAAVWLRGAAE